jgi:hypothetical protein
MRKAIFITLVSVLLGATAFAQAAPARKMLLGILPTFDAGGEAHGEIYTQNLTSMLFEEFRTDTIEPVLLNPGGMYNPLSTELILEYGRDAGVDGVLITSLQRTEKPKHGDWVLKVTAQLMEMKDGKTSEEFLSTQYLKSKDVVVEHGHVGWMTMAGWATAGSRPFEKQPLGKSARRVAQDFKTQAAPRSLSLISGRSAPPVGARPAAATAPCNVNFHVAYIKQKAVSKAYDVAINGREESLNIKEGYVAVSLPTGPVFVHTSVKDAPYKMPVQHLYQMNTYLDCGAPQHDLVLEIGPAGDAVLR